MNTSLLLTMLREDPNASTATDLLTQAGGHVYIVGGAVRDLALGKSPKDIDLMVTGLEGDQIEQALQGQGRLDLTGKSFGVYRFKVAGPEGVEIAMPRVEYGNTNTDFYTGSDIPVWDDLGRRDFTANAMAVDTQTGTLVDPYNGAQDIDQGILRTVNPNAFQDDPTRLLRGVTAISKHDLTPDADTLQRMEDESQTISSQPPERLQMELDKILSGSNPAEAFRLADQVGLLKWILPEVSSAMGFDQQNPHHDLDVGAHLLAALDAMTRLSNDPDMRLAALLHDIGKPDSFWLDPNAPEGGGGHFYKKKLDDDSISDQALMEQHGLSHGDFIGEDHEDLGADYADALMRRLRYPNARRERVVFLIRNHMFPYFNNLKGARKFLNLCGGDAKMAFDLLNLREADASGKQSGALKDYDAEMLSKDRDLVQQVLESQQAITPRDLAINGRDLINIGMKPGPQMGQIINTLLDAVLENPELNTPETLSDMANALIQHQNVARLAEWRDSGKSHVRDDEALTRSVDTAMKLADAIDDIEQNPDQMSIPQIDNAAEMQKMHEQVAWDRQVQLEQYIKFAPDYKWSWDGEKLDVWPTKSFNAPGHFERTGPGYRNLAQGRIYIDKDGFIEIHCWADRGTNAMREQGIEEADQWCLTNLGEPSDIVTYERENHREDDWITSWQNVSSSYDGFIITDEEGNVIE